MASMERSRECCGSPDMAKCPLLLFTRPESKIRKRSPGDVFECKTCHRQFSSFQALGGHRASHKRPKVVLDEKMGAKFLSLVTNKPKMHECTICGLEFSMGQALGGHMRRHRALLTGDSFPEFRVVAGHNHHVEAAPVMRRSNSCNKRVFGLDLNLTPLENDLVVVFGKMAPKVDVFA